ncbi:MAG: MFS transporter [Candidatus Nomurabacteria bacterium]|nr:MAG: MFS transporter [Candidatus Nomurabacteria bacterium]
MGKEQRAILLYGSNIWYLGEGMLGPLFAVFAEQVGGDVLEITWAWATYLIVGGVLHILFGKIIDQGYSKEKMMMLGYALNALFTFGYLFVSSPLHLLIVQAGLGVAAALATPTWDALYAKYEDRKHDTYEWGISEGTALIVTGAAIILGGVVVTQYSFQTLFIVMGSIQTIATIYQARILRKRA